MQNRKIAFRAWDESTKTMHSDIKHHFGFAGETLEKAAEEGLNDLIAITQKAYILMQFTGLTDKNGKEIYEGDVLELTEGGNENVVVIWDTDAASFKCRKSNEQEGYCDNLYGANLTSVIGNIYENPDLIPN